LKKYQERPIKEVEGFYGIKIPGGRNKRFIHLFGNFVLCRKRENLKSESKTESRLSAKKKGLEEGAVS